MSLEQLQYSCSFPFSLNFTAKIHERFLFSGVCKFKRRKWRLQFSPISCSSIQRGLLPRPTHKPSKLEHGVEEETDLEENPTKSCNSKLSGQIEKLVICKRYQEALELFEMMECEGDVDVGATTYDALVNACIGLKSIRGVKRVFNHMINCKIELDQYLRNRVLLMHVKCRMMVDARVLFDEMPERNLVSWNMIIGGLVDSGDYKEAFRLFLMMWEEYSDAGTRTFATMIRASAGLERIFLGRQLHCCALKMDVSEDVYVSCALIDMYSKCGSIFDAHSVFYDMPNRTTVAWNSIISGYAFNGYSEEAFSMYYEMQHSGAKMDHFTFSIIIRTCARLASVENAKQLHAGLVRHGFALDIVTNTALVDLYSKWGKLEDAKNVFEKMPKKNVISWNALIAGYGNHGRGIEAVELFERMVREEIVPNHVTFLAVLTACSYSSLSNYGCEIFESMSRDYKVKPRAMHYACMIDLLGREGLLDEAFALIRDAPFKPTVNMWAALLTACRVHKNLVLGTFAAEKIYEMEPEKLSNYIVLLNIYSSSGKIEEAAGVFRSLKRKGFGIPCACTWIEIKKQTHAFVSQDPGHEQEKEIYEKLGKLMVEICKHGYVPEEKSLLPDVDEEEEKRVMYHSERLAICFGLINSSCSTPLHLVQSHRICSDCHRVIKLISTVTGRDITVRDASRFHHFKGGKCSCGDYW